MITYEEARKRVMIYLRTLEDEAHSLAEMRKDLSANERKVLGLGETDEVQELVIDDARTTSEDFGWVYFFQTSGYAETQDPTQALIGHGPLIVSKSDGKIYETGMAEPPEVYIENLRRHGHPLER